METLRVGGIGKHVNFSCDSECSTPYVSAPSSPGRSRSGFFFSAPTSPMRSPARPPPLPCRFEQGLKMEDDAASGASASPSGSGSDFEFSARFSEFDGGAVSADELFFNGQIRPMMLSSHLEKPQVLRPLIDLEDESKETEDPGGSLAPQRRRGEAEEEELQDGRGRERGLWRDTSRHRRARSMSPLRSSSQWEAPQEEEPEPSKIEEEEDKSKASSAKKGRSGSKRWISLKDFLYRSKSEGRGHAREKPWALSFSSSPAKQQSSSNKSSSKKQHQHESSEKQSKTKSKNALNPNAVPVPNSGNQSHRNTNGQGARRVPVSAHELHYTANRAQAEELRRKTYLPYKHGLFGCMGFSSKSYTTMNGLARSLHPALS